MTSLDTLSTSNSELTGEQLERVDGGLVWVVIGGLVLLDAYIWGKVAEKYS